MSSNKVENPYPIFTDTDGRQLENGFIYVGQPGLDAEFNQVSIYLDPELTTPVSQPVRTSGGYPVVNGAVFRFYVDGNHSIKVKNKNGELVYSANNSNSLSGSASTNFATLADAKAATYLIDGCTVKTDGYYSQGDGGSNEFYYDSSSSATANDGSIVALNTLTGRLIQKNTTRIHLKQFGAKGDGSTDDRAALNSATALSEIIFPSGTYSVQSDLTLSVRTVFEQGAKLKPSSGITITITGQVIAGEYQQIFDMSAGGSIQFEIGATSEAFITWFGAVSDDESGSVSTDNVTAIDECIKACDVATGGDIEGDAVGSFRNIPVVIPAGMYSIDAADINVPSYAVIYGRGDSSILGCKNGTNSYAVFKISTAGANSIYMHSFAIYGDQANQTGTINGIEFAVASGAKPIYNNFHNLVIKEMSGNALKLGGSINAENCRFSDSMFRDSKGHNIYIARANNCDFNNLRVRSAKTGSSGCLIDGSANNSLSFNNCRMEGNNACGLYLSNTGGRMVVDGGSYSSNGEKGIFIDRVNNMVLDGAILCELNTQDGITIDQSDNLLIGKGVLCRSNLSGLGIYSSNYADIDIKAVTNQQHGILVSACADCNIKGSAIGNSQATDATYNGVMIQSNSDNNNVEVYVRHAGLANQHKYGVEINDAPSTANRVTNCDLLNSGKTGSLQDSGTSTVTTAGNRT